MSLYEYKQAVDLFIDSRAISENAGNALDVELAKQRKTEEERHKEREAAAHTRERMPQTHRELEDRLIAQNTPNQTRTLSEKETEKIRKRTQRQVAAQWANTINPSAHTSHNNEKAAADLILRGLQATTQAASKDLDTARQFVRETISAIWEYIPILGEAGSEDENMKLNHLPVYWRGTILRRLIIDPSELSQSRSSSTRDSFFRVLHMDDFMGGAVQFTDNRVGAINFARSGFSMDPIRDTQRHDPIVIRHAANYSDQAEWERVGHKNPPSVLALNVENLIKNRIQLFRLK